MNRKIVAGAAVVLLLAAGGGSAYAYNKYKTDCAGYYALTYDDGPGPMTQQYLDKLQELGAKATFFEIGNNVKTYPGAGEAIKTAGQGIGNHTMTHPDLTTLDAAKVSQEIADAKTEQNKVGGDTYIVRPPQGVTNPAVRQTIESMGMRQVLWNKDTKDWVDGATKDSVVNVAMTAEAGDIILMHEGRQHTLDAMPEIVTRLRSEKRLCPGLIGPSNGERPTDVPSQTMNAMAVKP